MLSLAATYLAGAALSAGMFLLPWLLRPANAYYYLDTWYKPMLLVFYTCCPAGWAAIASLLKLLLNIRTGSVFTRQNVRLLRLLSWCFVFVALVSLAAFYWIPPLLVIFVAAGFLAIILRVVKNVMAEATILREENDLTI